MFFTEIYKLCHVTLLKLSKSYIWNFLGIGISELDGEQIQLNFLTEPTFNKNQLKELTQKTAVMPFDTNDIINHFHS